jgi:histone deacetylase 11
MSGGGDLGQLPRKRSAGSYIVNKNALKRIFLLYLPVFAALWLSLFVTGKVIDRPHAPLVVPADFKGKIPIVYSDDYNITFMGLEKYHPFDTTKYRRVFKALNLPKGKTIAAGMPSRALLLTAQTPEYLDSLNSAWTMARITELGFLRFFPNNLSREVILYPMMVQAGGSLLAGLAALEHGWAINLGGGFHHASQANGEGFCALADISLIVKELRREGKIKKAMIVDLDAHQGNGYERDFTGDKNVYILDMYNHEVFPHDDAAKRAISLKVELPAFTADAAYLAQEKEALHTALNAFHPDIIVYVAGTDSLAGDKLGALSISPDGIVKRDEMVFQAAFGRKIPIVMLLAGGYQKSDAPVIARSILNLNKVFHLWTP